MWLYALGVALFALGLLLSIALHEIGHLSFAKAFGVKVTQYMVGFGPTLWSRRRGDTQYGLKAIPLGGYIRMIGMVPPRPDGRRSRWPRRLARAVEEFREASRAEVLDPGDEPRQFYRLTPGKKILVMLGGPAMNFLIFVVLSIVLLEGIGTLVQPPPTTTVAAVSHCLLPAGVAPTAADPCPSGSVPAPAQGKLRPGDVITAINGRPTTTWTALATTIRDHPGQPLAVTVDRGGRPVTVDLTPAAVKTGTAASAPTIGQVGFFPTQPAAYFRRMPVGQVPGAIGSQVVAGVKALGTFPAKISSLFGTVFDNQPRDPNGAVGVVGLSRIGGQVAASHAYDLQQKAAVLLSLLAGMNLLLCFFNLLPLLPLDGGHVAGAVVEAARRGWGRARKRPWAGHVDTATMAPVMYGVASLLVVVTLVVVYADIVKPITLGG